MEGTKTHAEMRTELMDKVAADNGFRARLVVDPKAAIKEALNLDLPDAITVRVHEESATEAHLVLPPISKLAEADLETIAAGHKTTGGIYDADSALHLHPETWTNIRGH